MSAPKRWLDEGGDATPFERDLLRSGLDAVDPPAGAKGAVWAALLTQFPGAGGLGGAGAAGANGAGASGSAAAAKGGASAAGKVAAGKVVAGAAAGKGASAGLAGAAGAGLIQSALIGAGSALVVIATYTVAVPDKPDPAAIAPAISAAVTATARGPEPRRAAPPPGVSPPASAAIPAAPEVPPSAEPPSAEPRALDARSGGGAGRPDAPRAAGGANDAPPAPAAKGDENPLVEESRMMSEARAALRRGDGAGALAEIEKIRARFPGGGLLQEREALTIEALYKSGRKPEAISRAKAFLEAYPNSLHAPGVQAFTK